MTILSRREFAAGVALLPFLAAGRQLSQRLTKVGLVLPIAPDPDAHRNPVLKGLRSHLLATLSELKGDVEKGQNDRNSAHEVAEVAQRCKHWITPSADAQGARGA